MARLSREHNDANVLCLGSRLIEESVAMEAVDTFLSTDFEGGRHAGRLAKIDALEAWRSVPVLPFRKHLESSILAPCAISEPLAAVGIAMIVVDGSPYERVERFSRHREAGRHSRDFQPG